MGLSVVVDISASSAIASISSPSHGIEIMSDVGDPKHSIVSLSASDQSTAREFSLLITPSLPHEPVTIIEAYNENRQLGDNEPAKPFIDLLAPNTRELFPLSLY